MFIGSPYHIQRGSRFERIKYTSEQLKEYPDRIRKWKGSNRLLVSVLLGLYPFHYVSDPKLAYDVDWYKYNFHLPIEIEFSKDHILIYNKYNIYAPKADPLHDPRDFYPNLLSPQFPTDLKTQFFGGVDHEDGDPPLSTSLYDPSFPGTPLSSPFLPLIFSGADPAFKILNSNGDLYLIGDRYLYYIYPILFSIFLDIENQINGYPLKLIQLDNPSFDL